MMKEIITQHDWTVTDMPKNFEETFLNRKLSDDEYEALQYGFRPRDMDDRWFMYIKDGWLYLHRSWTGHCIFKVKIEASGHAHILTILHINRDQNQYKSTNAETDKNELNSVLSTLITLYRKSDDNSSVY